MLGHARPYRHLTVVLALTFVWPEKLPTTTGDEGAPAAGAGSSEAGARPRTAILRRIDSHKSRPVPYSLGADDQTDESDDGDDGCPLSPVKITASSRDLPLLISTRRSCRAPMPGRTPAALAASCRMRC